MDLNDMIAARRDRAEEEQNEQQARLERVLARLATVIGRADFSLSHSGDDLPGLRDAFEIVRNQLVQLLNQNDIELVGRPGEPLDSARHTVEEARREGQSGPPRVAEVLEYGALCTRDERLLQRARVVALVLENQPQE